MATPGVKTVWLNAKTHQKVKRESERLGMKLGRYVEMILEEKMEQLAEERKESVGA